MDNLESMTWFWNMSANKSESELDEGRQLDEEKPDFEFKTKVAVSLQPVIKEIF